MVDTQYKKGVLFLADVVNYTSQSTIANFQVFPLRVFSVFLRLN